MFLMKMVLIVAFNTLLQAFLPIQCINEIQDDDIVESHRRAVVGGKIPKEQAQNLIIYKLGSFDDTTGEVKLLDKPKQLVALSQFFPKKVDTLEVKTDGSSAN